MRILAVAVLSLALSACAAGRDFYAFEGVVKAPPGEEVPGELRLFVYEEHSGGRLLGGAFWPEMMPFKELTLDEDGRFRFEGYLCPNPVVSFYNVVPGGKEQPLKPYRNGKSKEPLVVDSSGWPEHADNIAKLKAISPDYYARTLWERDKQAEIIQKLYNEQAKPRKLSCNHGDIPRPWHSEPTATD